MFCVYNCGTVWVTNAPMSVSHNGKALICTSRSYIIVVVRQDLTSLWDVQLPSLRYAPRSDNCFGNAYACCSLSAMSAFRVSCLV